jgi:YbgC/YbaW family acyl-CoA thioester hydrolase
VDARQIVFFRHYLTYCNAASADYWRAVRFPLSAFSSLGGDLHVRRVTLEYHGAARYDDELDIGLRCARIGNSSLTYALGDLSRRSAAAAVFPPSVSHGTSHSATRAGFCDLHKPDALGSRRPRTPVSWPDDRDCELPCRGERTVSLRGEKRVRHIGA